MLLTILGYDSLGKRFYGVSRRRKVYMRSYDQYGDNWGVIKSSDWYNKRRQATNLLTNEVPVIPVTNRPVTPDVRTAEADSNGQQWAGGVNVYN